MLKIRLFPILILLLGLAVTFVISYSAFQDQKKLDGQGFEKLCLSFEGKIQKRLTANAQILYSSAAFVSSSDSISHKEWHEFQSLNRLHIELPGIRGIGYSVIVDKMNINHLEKQIRNGGFPHFKIVPEGDRDFYTAVIYIEPDTKHILQPLGFDGYTEPRWRFAMEQSRNTDLATITDKISIIQESGKADPSGMIVFAPVFKSGPTPADSASRKKAIIGWVFTTYRMNELMKSVLGEWDYKKLRIKVYDRQALIADNLMFDSDSVFQVRRSSRSIQNLKIPTNFNGHVWTLEFSGYNTQGYFLPARILIVLANGLIISVLLFILVVGLINARTKTMQIQKLNEELEKVNKNKDRFVSLLAHDLKSPFNALLGFSELLAENLTELRSDELQMYVDRIYNSAKVSYNLLDELLIWARVQSDQFPFRPENINLNELCQSLVNDHVLVADKKNISVSFQDSEPVLVFADELMLKTILRNLLVNGIKFTNPGGSVQIKIEKEDTKVIVSVSDSGVGMSPDEIAKLFDITNLKSKPGTANEKGTGLGLLLCKDMVIKHGGEIWVESTVAKGSVFRFLLPLAQDF